MKKASTKGTRMISIIVGLVLSTGLLGCSQTPGDAAYRAGHPNNAAALYKRGAEQGDALAAFKLARLLSTGEVAEETYGKSGPWDVKACELGKVVGCHNAGVGHENGSDGLAKDYELARRFYLKAAEYGYPFSQYNLGSMYANQYLQDDKEGYRWMMIARQFVAKCAAQGDKTCQWVLDDPPGHVKKLAERLSQSDREDIEAAAKNWTPTEN